MTDETDETGAMLLTLPVPPSANRYWRHVGTRIIISAAAKKYREEIAYRASIARCKPLAGPVAVSVTVYRKIKSGDLDNYLKVLLDSLRGVCYADDGQIVEIHAVRRDDKEKPRVVIAISRAD